MNDITSEIQSGFVQDRQIMDGVIEASETVSWLKKKKKHGALLKLDFNKAYASMTWSFIDHMLFQFGFGSKMIG